MGREGVGVSSRGSHPRALRDHPGVEAPDPGEDPPGYHTLIQTPWVEVEGLCDHQIEEVGALLLVRHILIQVPVVDQKNAEMDLLVVEVGLLVGVGGPLVVLLVAHLRILV